MLHGSLMASTGILIIASQYFLWVPDSKVILIYFSSYAVLDFLMQVTVCYICYTMGSDGKLRDFDCTIVITQSGEPILQIKRRGENMQTSFDDNYTSESSI